MWKVLVVDDDTTNRKLIKEMLAEKAICDDVGSGKDALLAFEVALAIKNPYDIILLDVQMPEVDGITLLKKFREIEKKQGIRLGKGVPVMMVTAFAEPFWGSFQGGADGYLLKPIIEEDLLEKIEKFLKKKN